MYDELIGSVKRFAGNFCPKNYMFADGQILPIDKHQALYSLLGNRFGGDISKQTFGLPNLNKDIDKKSEVFYIICIDGIYPIRD